MLKGDADALKPGSSWADDVSALGNYCVSARQPPHVDGARFAFFLLELAANRWPSEADDLVGVYKDASEKMHGLLEESGWRMALKVRARFLRLGACEVFLFFSLLPLLLLFLLLFLLFSSRFLSSLYDTQGEKEDDTGVAGGYDEVLEEIESSGGGDAGGGEEKGESPVAE